MLWRTASDVSWVRILVPHVGCEAPDHQAVATFQANVFVSVNLAQLPLHDWVP